jgi:hypothetical protein
MKERWPRARENPVECQHSEELLPMERLPIPALALRTSGLRPTRYVLPSQAPSRQGNLLHGLFWPARRELSRELAATAPARARFLRHPDFRLKQEFSASLGPVRRHPAAAENARGAFGDSATLMAEEQSSNSHAAGWRVGHRTSPGRDMLVRVSTDPASKIRELLPDQWKAEHDAAAREAAAARAPPD